MSLKDRLKKIRKKIADSDPTSAFSRWYILFIYKTWLLATGRFRKRKEKAYEVIDTFLAEERKSDRKYVKYVYNDIFLCRFLYGMTAKEYFTFEFEKLSHEGRKTYLTRGNRYFYYNTFNSPNYTNFFHLKTETIRKFGQFYKRDALCMYGEEDFEAFSSFVASHPRFIYKPANDYGGHGIEIYDASHYESVRDLFDIIMFNGFCVVEELIVQADEIGRFHPQSVNTVRVVAFLRPDGETEIKWCLLRMGMGGSHIDNMSSGGLAAMIDPETGVIYTSGRNWLGITHICHPDTGVQLVGYKMPEWEKLKETVTELSHVIPQVRLVGWDLAYTEKGWVLVEGNARPQCVSAQITEFNGNKWRYQELVDKYS